jgi:hypothetical protein
MQFGRALLQILPKVARSDPLLGPVYLSKIDISNGFYRIAIRSEDVPKLAIMFPTEEGEEHLIVLPYGFAHWMETAPPPCSQRRPKRLQTWQAASSARSTPASHTAWMPFPRRLFKRKKIYWPRLPDLSRIPRLFMPFGTSLPSQIPSNPGVYTWMILLAWSRAILGTINMSNASC